jgi:hypothetical protein
MKYTSFPVPLDIYQAGIWFVVSEDHRRSIKFVNYKYGLPNPSAPAFDETEFAHLVGKTFCHSLGWPIIWLPSFPKKPIEHAFVAHEIFHAVYDLLAKAGIRLSFDSDEAYAYLIGHITQKFYEKAKK